MNVLKLFKNLFSNPVNFFKQWGEGYKKLTAKDYAKAKYQGHLFGIIGLIFAVAFIIVQGSNSRVFIIFICSMIWLQIWEYRKFQKQFQTIDKMEKQLKGDDTNV